MQFKNDITRKVAEEAARIMAEALKGNQHKIDKNKNNKVDAEDFKILRGEKKANEEVEQVDELNKSTLQSYAGKVIDKTRTMPQGEKKQKHLTGLGKAMDKMKEKEKANSQKFGKDVKEEAELTQEEFDSFSEEDKNLYMEMLDSIETQLREIGLLDEEQLDEISTTAAKNYLHKALPSSSKLNQKSAKPGEKAASKSNYSYENAPYETKEFKKFSKRRTGIRKAIDKLASAHPDNKKHATAARRAFDSIHNANYRVGMGEPNDNDRANIKSAHKAIKTAVDTMHKNAMKEEVELDEALWPGTPEYEKKFPKASKPGERRKTQDYGYQGKEEEHGETTFRKEVKPAKRGKYGARQNYIRSRKVSGKTLKDDVEVGFTDILEAYDSHGLKFISAMMKEEPDNEQFTKEVEEQKKRDKGEIRNDKGVAKPLQNASVSQSPVNPVREESENVEEGVLGSIAAGVGSFIGNKIDPTHGEMLRTHGPEVVRQLRYHATNAVNKAKNKIMKKEEVEEIEERTLTEPETAKKEEIVKSMKKGVKGFKQRYGERAKSVMYATATKIAKEKA